MMKLNEFLAWMALDQCVSNLEAEPKEYGFDSWQELYKHLAELDEFSVELKSDVEIYLTEDYANLGTFSYVLPIMRGNADWIIDRMNFVGGIDYAV